MSLLIYSWIRNREYLRLLISVFPFLFHPPLTVLCFNKMVKRKGFVHGESGGSVFIEIKLGHRLRMSWIKSHKNMLNRPPQLSRVAQCRGSITQSSSSCPGNFLSISVKYTRDKLNWIKNPHSRFNYAPV